MNTLLLNKASSALTSEPSLNLVKPSYGFINTETLANRFESQGWKLINASQASVRNLERQGFQKHLLTFEHESFRMIDGLSKNNESKIRIVLKNSHDGSSSLELIASVFRLACLNGLMVASGTLGQCRVIHSGNVIKRLDDSIEDFTTRLPIVAERIRAMQSIQLNNEQVNDFKNFGALLRLEDTPHEYIDINSVGKIKRIADNASDLFTVYNRVQESVIRGGIEYKTTIKRGSFDVKEWRKARAIVSIPKAIKLNQALWSHAESLIA